MSFPWSLDQDVESLVRSLPNGFTKTYVLWCKEQTDAPLWYHVVAGLAVVSAVIPPHLSVGGDLPESGMFGNLYTLLVGRQGMDRKSTALKKGTDLLKEAVPERRGDEPGSPQGFVASLVDRPQQLLVYEDMADLFAMTQRRSGGNQLTALKGKLLRAFDCDPVSHRLRRVLLREENPRLSILGGVNRPILDVYVDPEDFETGLMSRFLVALGQRHRILYRRASSPHVRQRLIDWLGHVAGLSEDTGAWGECVGVDPQAELLLASFEHAMDVTAPTRGARTCGPRARARTMAVKIAFLLCFAAGYGHPSPSTPGQPGANWTIPGDIMQTAIRFALMGFAGSLAITYTATGSKDMQDRKSVLEAIRPTWTPVGEITLSSQQLLNRTQQILQTLVVEGTVEGRPSASGKMDYRLTGLNQFDGGVPEAIRDVAEIAHAYMDVMQRGGPADFVKHGRIYAPASALPGISPIVPLPALSAPAPALAAPAPAPLSMGALGAALDVLVPPPGYVD